MTQQSIKRAGKRAAALRDNLKRRKTKVKTEKAQARADIAPEAGKSPLDNNGQIKET